MPNSNPKNPMKGLLPFEESDASKYYIDARQVEAFTRQLERSHFMVLRGSKGVGKTSFLNAVFSEAYKKIRPENDHWIPIYIRPGLNPLKSMAYQLSMVRFSEVPISPDFALQAETLLDSSSNGLAELFENHHIVLGAKLLLIIDPLDDLFLLSDISSAGVSAEQRIMQFINMLCVFEQQCKDIPIYVVISFSNSVPEKIGSYPKFLDLMERNKFVFKGPQIDELPQILTNIMPQEVQKSKGYGSFVDLILTETKAELSDSPEWLFHLQHALKRTLDLWYDKPGDIGVYYQQVGGVKNSIVQQADEIYQTHLSKVANDERHRKIYELFLRSLMDGKGTFIPLKYSHILDVATRYYKEGKDHIEKSLIRPFVKDLGPLGLGFLEIIRSVEEADRAKVLMDEDLITENDILNVKNEYLMSQWPLLNTFKHAKNKLMNEYEWYARIALEKSNGKDYPTTLQPYALADPQRDKSKDPEEFHVIDELLLINEAWVLYNFGEARPDQASFEQTRSYIVQGIKHWRIMEQEEQAAVQKAARKKKRRIRFIGLTLLIGVLFYIGYEQMARQKNSMEERLDCLHYENKRILVFIDSLYIERLENSDHSDSTKKDLKEFMKAIRGLLKKVSSAMDDDYDNLYNENIFRFSLNYFSWRNSCEEYLNIGNGLHRDVLELYFGKEGFLKSNMRIMEIKSDEACDSMYRDAVYYINCKECETCKVCQ